MREEDISQFVLMRDPDWEGFFEEAAKKSRHDPWAYFEGAPLQTKPMKKREEKQIAKEEVPPQSIIIADEPEVVVPVKKPVAKKIGGFS